MENNTALTDLKIEAVTFEMKTKKMFSSCKRAILNVDEYSFYGVWGDFGSRKQAIAAMNMWAIAFAKKPECVVIDGLYRVSVDA